MKRKSEAAKELAQEFPTPARKLMAVETGRVILEPLLFEETLYRHKFDELRLQKALRDIFRAAAESKTVVSVDQAISDACSELGLKREWADKYFAGNRYKRWFADRLMELEANTGISVEYVALKHKQNIEGEIRLTSSQLESLAQIGDRLWPKVSKIEHQIERKEADSLDEMPDFEKKVNELQPQLQMAVVPTEVVGG